MGSFKLFLEAQLDEIKYDGSIVNTTSLPPIYKKDLVKYKLISDVHIPSIPHELFVYVNRNRIMCGYIDNDLFRLIMDITGRDASSYAIDEIGKYFAISTSNTDTHFTKMGVATTVYELIASKVSLVSDYSQSAGAKFLWKAIAKRGIVNVYYFDELTGEFTKYDGDNIPDGKIWNDSDDAIEGILIASTVEFQ